MTKSNKPGRLDVDMTGIDFSELLAGKSYQATGGKFTAIYDDDLKDMYSGDNLTYGKNDLPNGGTVKSIVQQNGRNIVFTVTGLSLDAAAIAQAAMTEELDDDEEAFQAALDGRNTISGGKGDDWLIGGDGNDLITGRAGDDIIFGDADNDRLTGGKGKDVFVFNDGDGGDIITDFRSGKDVIDLRGIDEVAGFLDDVEFLPEDFLEDPDFDPEFAGLVSFLEQYSVEDMNGFSLVFETVSIKLLNVDSGDFEVSDFIF